MSRTPGPWTWDDSGNLVSGKGLMVAASWQANIPMEADARLIAAAPELLVVAERYMAEVHMFHAQDSRTGRDYNDLCEIARAAIAKAKGTT